MTRLLLCCARTTLLLMLCAGISLAQFNIREQTPKERLWKRIWLASSVALAAGSAMDAYSSVGGVEANPLMRSPNGNFNLGRGIALKGGVSAALLCVQSFLIRRSPDHRAAKTAAFVNFGVGAALAGTAIRNRGMSAH
jgi:hypothetical protein